MSEMEQNPIAKKLQSATAELMKQKADLSEQMAIDCIMQAIKCGDFTRLLQGDKESYVYIPFQRERELQQKIYDFQNQQQTRYTKAELIEAWKKMTPCNPHTLDGALWFARFSGVIDE